LSEDGYRHVSYGLGGGTSALAMAYLNWVERGATSNSSWHIDWKPERLSAGCHGRDLFAPVAAMLARGEQRMDPKTAIALLSLQAIFTLGLAGDPGH
jgi:S-adenosylmethionine hydrolase